METFKTGDKAKVKELDTPMRGFSVGDTVTVDGFIAGHVVVSKPGKESKLIGYSEAKFLEPAIIEAGDKVRLKSEDIGAVLGFSAGDIVTVIDVRPGKDNDLAIGFPFRVLRGFTTSDNVELVEKAAKAATVVAEATPTCKFKVGEYVKGTSTDRYILTNTNMTKGVVTEIIDEGEIEVKILKAKPGTRTDEHIGESFEVDPKYFELADKLQVGDIVRGLPASNLKYSVTNENMTKGEIIAVDRDGIEIKVLENIDSSLGEGRTYGGLDPDVFELVPEEEEEIELMPEEEEEIELMPEEEVEVAEAPKKRYIRMKNDDFGYSAGEVFEVSESDDYFVDKDGDKRYLRHHAFEEIEGEVTFVEQPITKEKVIEYLSEVSASVLIDIMVEARK